MGGLKLCQIPIVGMKRIHYHADDIQRVGIATAMAVLLCSEVM